MFTTSAGGPDPEILELFRSELDTHLPVLSDGLLALEKGQVDDAQIEAMMRAAHSIKGAARIVGVDPAVRVAHALEDCFSSAKSKKIVLSSDNVDVLLEGVDALQQICSPAEGVQSPAIEPLLDRIKDVGVGKAAPPEPAKVTNPAPVAEPPLPARRAADAVNIQLPAVLDESAALSFAVQWADVLTGDPQQICFDLSQVREVGAAGMAMVVAFVRAAARGPQAPVILFRGAQPPVARLWRVLGLFSLVEAVQ